MSSGRVLLPRLFLEVDGPGIRSIGFPAGAGLGIVAFVVLFSQLLRLFVRGGAAALFILAVELFSGTAAMVLFNLVALFAAKRNVSRKRVGRCFLLGLPIFSGISIIWKNRSFSIISIGNLQILITLGISIIPTFDNIDNFDHLYNPCALDNCNA